MSTKGKNPQEKLPRENLNQFKKRIAKNRLTLKDEIMLIDSGDALRFQFYVEKHTLSFRAERKLISSRRKELFDIYFEELSARNEKCHEDNEVLLVQIPAVFKSYHAAGLIPGKKAQMYIVTERKRDAIRRFIRVGSFYDEAEKLFLTTADDELLAIYGERYKATSANLLHLIKIKAVERLRKFVSARGIPTEVIDLLAASHA